MISSEFKMSHHLFASTLLLSFFQFSFHRIRALGDLAPPLSQFRQSKLLAEKERPNTSSLFDIDPHSHRKFCHSNIGNPGSWPKHCLTGTLERRFVERSSKSWFFSPSIFDARPPVDRNVFTAMTKYCAVKPLNLRLEPRSCIASKMVVVSPIHVQKYEFLAREATGHILDPHPKPGETSASAWSTEYTVEMN